MEILTTYFLIDLFLWNNFNEYKNTRSKKQPWYNFLGLGVMVSNATFNNIYIIMWSCPGNMPKYYPGLRDITPPEYAKILPRSETYYPTRRAYYLDQTTLISLLYWVSNCPGNMPKYYSTKYHYRNLREV